MPALWTTSWTLVGGLPLQNHPYYLWPLGLKRFAQTFSNIDFFITLLLQPSNKLIVFRVTALFKLAICANQMSVLG